MTIIVKMHWIYRNRRGRVSNESELGTEGGVREFGMSGSDAVAKEEWGFGGVSMGQLSSLQ
ncbi:MAG: hypothetical protein ACRDHN_09695 [Thermomicrobiales bacterium]